VTSTIRITATVSPADAPGGFVAGVLQVSGIFTPSRAYFPAVMPNPSNNHDGCSALAVTPPATVTQVADHTFNLYRFTATNASYDVTVVNYPAAGDLILYSIQADYCAISSTMFLKVITSTALLSSQPMLKWTLNGVFTPGVSYMLAVYNRTLVPSPAYTLSIVPRPALNLADGAWEPGSGRAGEPRRRGARETG
jgi:hypothetical protein